MDDSVGQWLAKLSDGSDEAAAQLWDRYFEKVVEAARRRLRDIPRRAVDEEDVAVSVFASLCRGADEGRFAGVRNRDEFWRLLLALTRQKVVDRVRRETRQKRGGGAVRGESVFGLNPAEEGERGIEQFASSSPTPEFLVMFAEESRLAMEQLEESVRPFVTLRLEGYEQADIAKELGVSLSTVERKLRLVRETWSRRLSEQTSDQTR